MRGPLRDSRESKPLRSLLDSTPETSNSSPKAGLSPVLVYQTDPFSELSSPCLSNGKAASTIPAGAAPCPQNLTLGGRHQQGA